MADKTPRPGIVKALQLDFDAVALLLELAPSPKNQGRFVSELIRAEQIRREESAKIRKVLDEVLA